MLKTVKIRLYPTSQQKIALAKAMGSVRWLWNYFLNLTNQTYKDTSKGLNRGQLQGLIPGLKKQEETEWLGETYSQCLQVVALNLSNAFINFFERRAGYPSFKSKHGKQSLSYPQNVKIIDSYLKFPKLGLIKARIHRPVKGSLKTVTITKNKCGQYYASILFEDGNKKPKVSTDGKAIGIDLGLNHFAISSDGSKFNNPRWFKKHEKNLKIKQQQVSRKEKQSNNRNKARLKLAKVHNKITRCREDFLHKLSRKIVNENQVICVENLAVSNMVKNHPPAFGTPLIKGGRGDSQVGWGMFCTMLKYKAVREGKVYQEVDRFFASSKTCSVCLNKVVSLPLDVRSWTCNNCHTSHDRDVNAAINIRDEGLRILASGTGATAYRPDVRRNGRGRKKSSVTQLVG